MKRFEAGKFVAVSNWLSNLAQKINEGEWIGFLPETYQELVEETYFICRQLEALDLQVSASSAKKLAGALENGIAHEGGIKFSVPETSRLKQFCSDLTTRVRDELDMRVVGSVSV